MKKDIRIKKVSAADMVFDKMKEFILNGTWPLHEKVPSEGELAEAFGVNRLTVRIALQRLNALGILDTRVGEAPMFVLLTLTSISMKSRISI